MSSLRDRKMLPEQSGVAVSGIAWYRAGNVDAFAVTNDGIQKGKKGMKPLQLKIVRSIKKGKKFISQQLMHTGCIYNFHFPSLPATSHLKERESSKEIILYLIYAILKIWPWSLSVRLKLHHITINYTANKKNESSVPMCISFSVQTKYPSSSPCDMRDELNLQYFAGLFFSSRRNCPFAVRSAWTTGTS